MAKSFDKESGTQQLRRQAAINRDAEDIHKREDEENRDRCVERCVCVRQVYSPRAGTTAQMHSNGRLRTIKRQRHVDSLSTAAKRIRYSSSIFGDVIDRKLSSYAWRLNIQLYILRFINAINICLTPVCVNINLLVRNGISTASCTTSTRI